METIQFTQVYKKFGFVPALDGLDITVKRGEIFAFLGHNGAGKTTSLRAMLGLFGIDAGQISVFGMDPARQGDDIRKICGVLAEDVGLYEPMTVYDNLVYYAQLYGLAPAVYNPEIRRLMDFFEIPDKLNMPVKGFSTGMKKKVALIRALLHKPQLVLLDEPTSGLDPVSTDKLRHLILELAQTQGSTFILTTHNLDEVEKICDRITILRQGKNVYTQSMEALKANKQDLLSLYLQVEEGKP